MQDRIFGVAADTKKPSETLDFTGFSKVEDRGHQ